MDIYVGNLAYATTDDGLKAAFAAQAAIDALNGQPLDGRPVRVNESQPKPRTERRGGFGGPRRDRGDRGDTRW